MADKTKTQETKLEVKEYIIPLRKEWRKVANYRRTGRAIKFIKYYIARHMKVPDRDISKVKLDIYLNQEIWFRGRKKPPARIKVRAIRDGEIVKVELFEIPTELRFQKVKHEKRHKAVAKVEKKPDAPPPAAKEEKKASDEKKDSKEEKETKEEKEEKKKESDEKSQAAAEQKADIAKQQAQVQKHAAKPKDIPIHRKALKK